MEARDTSPVDGLLQSFLQSTDDGEAERLLEIIISDHASPLIKNIVKYKIVVSAFEQHGRQDADDVCSTATLGLLARLQGRRNNNNEKPITNFRSYVAAIAYNTCHEHLREKYPLRHALRNRLRYLLTHDQQFSLWEGENAEMLCGLAEWQKESRSKVSASEIWQLRDGSQVIQMRLSSVDPSNRRDLTALLNLVFNHLASPVELDDLVALVAEVSGIKDQTRQTLSDRDQSSSLSQQVPHTHSDFANELERRSYLGKLWLEISELPDKQRGALLLNLKDSQGGGGISLFQMTGVASLLNIAQALSLTPEQLAGLWNDLPLDDLTIASRLCVTRQQVINLRKSARERLARRMKAYR